jgi:hypothetical protein
MADASAQYARAQQAVASNIAYLAFLRKGEGGHHRLRLF